VRKVFQRLGYPYRVAVLLANLCTVDGSLPQGASTSPALSNLVCTRLDRRFSGLAKKMGFHYSRYADDLVFSSNNPRLPSLIPLFREILSEEGFRVNEGKTRIMRKGRRQVVTGLITNQYLNLPREQVRRLRAAIHRLKTGGAASLDLRSRRGRKDNPLQVLQGHLGFLRMVDPKRADKLEGRENTTDHGALPE
jgi:retron-type reverse transcriptase